MMSIQFEHAIDIPQTPEQTFAVLDDLAQTPKWLARCVKLERLSPGPNAVGARLKYEYRESGRVGAMDGEITARTPNERLTCRYADKMMDVVIDFRVTRTATGSRLVHAIDITPKTFLGRLMSPLIRRQVPKQTITAMESLRVLVAATDAR